MQKILKFVLVTLVFSLIIEQNKLLAITSGPLPQDVSYSEDENFDSPNIFFNIAVAKVVRTLVLVHTPSHPEGN